MRFLALKSLLQEPKFAWLYFWLQINNFKTNLVIFYKFISMYISGTIRKKTKMWVKALEAVSIKV